MELPQNMNNDIKGQQSPTTTVSVSLLAEEAVSKGDPGASVSLLTEETVAKGDPGASHAQCVQSLPAKKHRPRLLRCFWAILAVIVIGIGIYNIYDLTKSNTGNEIQDELEQSTTVQTPEENTPQHGAVQHQSIFLSGSVTILELFGLNFKDSSPIPVLIIRDKLCELATLTIDLFLIEAEHTSPLELTDCFSKDMKYSPPKTPIYDASLKSPGVIVSYTLRFLGPSNWNSIDVKAFLRTSGSLLRREMLGSNQIDTGILIDSQSVVFNDGNYCLSADCGQVCNRLPWAYSCSCLSGYRLDQDNHTCVDIDECAEIIPVCAGNYTTCVNTAGRYVCLCELGYERTLWSQHCRKSCPYGSLLTRDNTCGCAPSRWQCANERCILGIFRCDGDDDCFDYSDETNCTTVTAACQSWEWPCADGGCISAGYRCDGGRDCSDGSDEADCFLTPTATACQSWEWLCADGGCISAGYRCDGGRDCSDGSDEADCFLTPTARECGAGEWECANKKCLLFASWRCDHFDDCGDNSDEEGCAYECRLPTADKWRCYNDRCIDASQRCDGADDCGDNSDETLCSMQGCFPDEWKCDNGQCINPIFKCDGFDNCGDKSDELNCTRSEGQGSCDYLHWECDNKACIRASERCDHYGDCSDDSDEDDCGFECEPWQWMCANGRCINRSFKCDGHSNCGDQSDEANCTSSATQGCHAYLWQCGNGRCIGLSLKCDGNDDCLDNTDELNCTASEGQGDCSISRWECKNKRCIRQKYRCDFDDDCGDNSDEIGCGYGIDCFSGQWQCNDTSCIPSLFRCDGEQDCLDGGDEIDCEAPEECRADQWQCQDRRCIAVSYVCDGESDCHDNSDEVNCTEAMKHECPSPYDRMCDDGQCLRAMQWCNGLHECNDSSDETYCKSNCAAVHGRLCGSTCLAPHQICDGNINCDDMSDEMKCDCTKFNRFQCDNGACIRDVFVCNKIDDCTDATDEKNCSYCTRDGDFLCPSNQRCVPDFTVCDGETDCPDGEDELNCQSRFRCSADEQVAMAKMCDGVQDCVNGQDELSCVRLDAGEDTNKTEETMQLLLLAYRGHWYPVCPGNLPETVPTDVCNNLRKGIEGTMTRHIVSEKYINTTNGWMHGGGNVSVPTLPFSQRFTHKLTCDDNLAVLVSCQNTTTVPGGVQDCGRRSERRDQHVASLIIGGARSVDGRWPWQVSIFYKRGFVCGGAVISDRYVVSAGHCFGSLFLASLSENYVIKAGTSKTFGHDTATVYNVSEITRHPSFDRKTLANDIALIRTAQRITFTDRVRPVCLAPANRDNLHQTRCYTTGWGIYTPFRSRPNELREARMKLFPIEVCEENVRRNSANRPELHVDNQKMICADQQYGDVCYGDSGGPLVCRQPDDTFQLIGVTSWGGAPYCDTYTLFANVSTYARWIGRQAGILVL